MEFGLEEIHSTVSGPPEAQGSSFTALLELPPTQAMELINNEDFQVNPMRPPIFPSNFAIVGLVPRLSTYATLDNSPESRTIFPASSSMKLDFMKQESPESDSLSNSSSPAVPNQSLKPCKRKATEKKVKELSKKSKNPVSTEGFEASGEKPPYVHVRARRGQATNSHSLAERARREKINARMKLLQELVPGCDKISGTAMVLDEIINHVQALQRQVEFLSMRLAAVNPRVDFDLVAHLAADNGSSSDNSYRGMLDYPVLPEGHINVNGQHKYHQPLHMDGVRFRHPWWFREDTSNFIIPDHSLLNYDIPL